MSETIKEIRYDKSGVILFNSYSKIGTEVLSNLHLCRLEYEGKVFNSSEQLFFWLRLTGYPEHQEALMLCATPKEAKKKGTAYIQTVSPEHPVIVSASNQDYEAFYNEEINMRKLSLQPPFCDIMAIGFSGTDEEKVKTTAKEFYKILKSLVLENKEKLPVVLFNATPAGIYRLHGKYRYRIILKCKNTKKFRDIIRNAVKVATQKHILKNNTITIDINGDIT